MITRQFSLEQMPGYPFERDYDIQRIAFFDIETTGFAAESTYLYLIGCSYYKDGSFQLIQWFSEDIREEALLLTSFFSFLNNYEVLLHYNGTGFDLPYLQKKCSLLGLDYSFDQFLSIDLYKKISPIKKIFPLNNFRQKTLELFLNVKRTDTASGGDLIQVYQSYLGKKHYEDLIKKRKPAEILQAPSEAELLLHQLLLHNEDDLRGLLLISPILNYVELFEKPIRILQAGVDGNRFVIHFELSVDLPVPVTFGNDLAHITAGGTRAVLSIYVLEGELKHFYDNYKDYYYLPAEDTVLHKSVADFVDKAFKSKAKPSNCYVRKHGVFAPQYEPILQPYFKQNYQDKLTFLEVHTDYLLREEVLEQYVHHMLKHVVSK